MQRYLSIWFPYLLTDRAIQLKPELSGKAFVLAAPSRGRMVVHESSVAAMEKGLFPKIVVADARAILPTLQVFNYKEGVAEKLLHQLAEWALRFTPLVAIDSPDGLLLDISGCTHLWGGEDRYLSDIANKLIEKGYQPRLAIADTIGTAWAAARYGSPCQIVVPGGMLQALRRWPPAALRLSAPIRERMHKLGFYKIDSFIDMPHPVLRRRFGHELLTRMRQALGTAPELLNTIGEPTVFQSRLPCLEPVRTRIAIEIALQKLLHQLCRLLLHNAKGLRRAIFTSYRLDGQIQQIEIGTNRPVRNAAHLLKLFEQKIEAIKPGLGIELFLLEAPLVEDLSVQQESLWTVPGEDNQNTALSNLLDRIAGKVGVAAIKRYLPAQHYWPERSIKISNSLTEQPDSEWKIDRIRPIYLLKNPQKIQVTVPLPDYPPLLFIYQGRIYKVKKADGPERIEREWWIDKQTQIRDYYRVEDEAGARYWLFRSGKYDDHKPEWFLHGFFA
jgi:protein ImuB